MFNYRPKKVVDLSDGDSNSVYSLDGKYLYKKFNDTAMLAREVSALYLMRVLGEQGIPMLIAQGNDFLVSEFISTASSAYDFLEANADAMSAINVKVASLVARVARSYKMFNQSKMSLYPELSWKARSDGIKGSFVKNERVLSQLIGVDGYRLILDKVKEVTETDCELNEFTLLHRDLHFENILMDSSAGYLDFYFIDMEHAMEGPIELEFQNSLLWNDDKSLNVEEIVKILKNDYQIDYSTEREALMMFIYLAEQLNLATKSNNWAKVTVLMDKYYIYRRKGDRK